MKTKRRPVEASKSALHFLHSTDDGKWIPHLPMAAFKSTAKLIEGLPRGVDDVKLTSWSLASKPLTAIDDGGLCIGDILTVTAEGAECVYFLTPRGWINDGDYANGVAVAMKREEERIAKKENAKRQSVERKKAEKIFLLANIAHFKGEGHEEV